MNRSLKEVRELAIQLYGWVVGVGSGSWPGNSQGKGPEVELTGFVVVEKGNRRTLGH